MIETKFAIGLPLPCFKSYKRRQTKASFLVRSLLGLLGAATMAVGLTAVFAPHFHSIGTIGSIGGWSMVAGGGIALFTAAAVKRVEKRRTRYIVEQEE